MRVALCLRREGPQLWQRRGGDIDLSRDEAEREEQVGELLPLDNLDRHWLQAMNAPLFDHTQRIDTRAGLCREGCDHLIGVLIDPGLGFVQRCDDDGQRIGVLRGKSTISQAEALFGTPTLSFVAMVRAPDPPSSRA